MIVRLLIPPIALLVIVLVAFCVGQINIPVGDLMNAIKELLNRILALVLSGIAIAALLGASISMIKLLSDPYSQLTVITFWMMGSLTMATMSDLAIVAPLLFVSIIPLIFAPLAHEFIEPQ